MRRAPGSAAMTSTTRAEPSRGCRGATAGLEISRLSDVTPKGRNEGPRHNLVDWVRPHNMHAKGGSVALGGRYRAASCGCGADG